jgi:hypothetical protein
LGRNLRWDAGIAFVALLFTAEAIPAGFERPTGKRPLTVLSNDLSLGSSLGPILDSVKFLGDPRALESFLTLLDRRPPDWGRLHGSHAAVDERLFVENRQRDHARQKNPVLSQRIAFLWYGQLSTYRPEYSGFVVAIGSELISTSWGKVRFKAEQLPLEMIAVPPPEWLPVLRERISAGEHMEIGVLFIGHLVPEEAVIYDFSHESPGEGMIMPMVRVEQVEYLLKRSQLQKAKEN